MSVAAAVRTAGSTTPADLPADPLDLLPADAVVAVAMSGGVDSSVAAARCVEHGLRTVGITLAMWPRTRALERDRGCCGVDAVTDARRVAATLGIRHYAWNLEEQFRDSIIRTFEDDYAQGRTPNPCVRCNDRIKFGELLQRALAVGATHVATGHYARVGRRATQWTLHRGTDRGKDQSYTLYSLGQARLQRAVFPIGAMERKEDVRRAAERLGLCTAGKAESQDLCFVDSDLDAALKVRLRGRYMPGPVFDDAGRELGRHRGLPFYTVGQRRGLGLRPVRPDSAPLHVLRIEPQRNAIVVGPRARLDCAWAEVEGCKWVDLPPQASSTCEVQVRAHGDASRATIIECVGTRLRVRFDGPARQVAPGQALVAYDGDEVLGGGTVAAAG